MNDTIEATLPESFYQTLQALSDTVTEGFNKLTAKEENNKNFLNPIDQFTKSDLAYNNSNKSDYEKLGAALFLGGTKSFFEYYKKVKRQLDYTSVENDSKQLIPNIVVNIPKDEKSETPPSNNFTEAVAKGIYLGLAILGIMGKTGALGQIAESAAYLPKLLKNTILDSKWRIATFNNISDWSEKISEPFDYFNKIGRKIDKLFEPIVKFINTKFNNAKKLIDGLREIKIFNTISTTLSKVVSFIGKAIGTLSRWFVKAGSFMVTAIKDLGGILGKSAAVILKPLSFALKRLPLIGTALGLYQAYIRFERGEIFQGVLEVAAAIFGLLPGPGTAIAVGINILQTLIDNNMGGGGAIGATKMLIQGIGKAAGKGLTVKLTNGLFKLLKPLGIAFKRIPILGSLINFGMAIYQFNNGDTAAGVINVISGLVGLLDLLVPGLGSILSLAIDTLSSFILTENGNLDLGEGSVLGSIGDWISDIFSWIWDKIKSIGKWIWDVISGAWNFVVDNIKSFFLLPFTLPSFVTEKTTKLFDWLPNILKSISEWPSKIWDFISGKIKGVKDAIVNKVKGAWNWVSGIFSSDNNSEKSEQAIKEEKISAISDNKTVEVTNQIEKTNDIVQNQNSINDNILKQGKNINEKALASYKETLDIFKTSQLKLIEGLDNLPIDNNLTRLRDKLTNYYKLFTGKLADQLATFEAKIDEKYSELSNLNNDNWVTDILSTVTDKVNSIINKTTVKGNIDKRLTDDQNLKINISSIDKRVDNLKNAFNKNNDDSLNSFKANEDKLVKSNNELLNAVISVRDAIINRPLSSGNNILINTNNGARSTYNSNLMDPRLAYV